MMRVVIPVVSAFLLTGSVVFVAGVQAAEPIHKSEHKTEHKVEHKKVEDKKVEHGKSSVHAKPKPAPVAAAVPEAKAEDLYGGAGVNRWLPKAEKGDIFAQYVLGHMYCVGEGVTKDTAQGLKWYQRAAEQGFAPGQLALGTLYYSGDGVKQDYTQAAKWFQMAADKGYDRAQNNLAALYLSGQGVPQDDKQAVKWYRAAANQGYQPAQYNLGMMYLDGRGVGKADTVAAYGLLRPLAEVGNPQAVAMIKQISAQMSAAQITQGQALAEQVRAKNRLNAALDDYEKIAAR